jgi:predicted RNA-binding protein with PUA-like domain
MRHWLFKSEPDVFSFADLQARKAAGEPWTGVRNYQARNYMRDDMSQGDFGLFYHSSCAEPGVAGLLKITKTASPDLLQFEVGDEYYDPKSTVEAPRWVCVTVAFHKVFKRFVSLEMLRNDPLLSDLLILRKGNRLSITPVEEAHFLRICELGGAG